MAQKVRDVMHAGAETIRPDDTIRRAASLMQAVDVGPLPVCDGERIVGIITDRDIVVRAVAAGRDPSTRRSRLTFACARTTRRRRRFTTPAPRDGKWQMVNGKQQASRRRTLYHFPFTIFHFIVAPAVPPV